MGTMFGNVVCDEHDIGGGGSNNDAQLDRINVLYYEDSRGKYVPRAVFFDLEPAVIGAVRASPLGELFCSENLVNHTRGQIWAKGHYRRADTDSSDHPLQKRQAPILLTPPPL
jgi:hypothetical protein